MARRVLFYTHALGGGGAEAVFDRLAKAFAAAGDDVIFAADYPGPEPVRVQTNLRYILLGPDHVTAMLRLRRLLGTERPDASFSALGAQNLKHLAAAILAGRRDRCVLGFHGFAIAEAGLISRSCFWASPLVTRLAARTICVSDALLDDMRRRWRASRDRTLRIYNPIGPALSPATGVARDEPPLVVACGRLVAIKRFHDLIAALPLVEPKTTRLTILGEGPERGRLEAEIVRLGLAGRVELPGHVADATSWYRRATCLAISSQSESFGLTAAEALAQGTPVVVTDCGGPAEIVERGRYGRIVPVGDAAALAAALTATIADPGNAATHLARAEAFGVATIHRAYAALADSLG